MLFEEFESQPACLVCGGRFVHVDCPLADSDEEPWFWYEEITEIDANVFRKRAKG